jgi:hypothetical protein
MSKKGINGEQGQQNSEIKQSNNQTVISLNPPLYVKPPDFDVVTEGFVPFDVLWTDIKTKWSNSWHTFKNSVLRYRNRG